MRDPIERAVQLCLRKQQRYARERQKQRDRKSADDLVQRHAADVDADDPGQRERENADVQLGETADEDRDDQRGERHVREIHAASLRAANEAEPPG